MNGYRIYRTAEGRHVLAGDPAAAYLAYTEADEVPLEVLEELGLVRKAKHRRETKRVKDHEDK